MVTLIRNISWFINILSNIYHDILLNILDLERISGYIELNNYQSQIFLSGSSLAPQVLSDLNMFNTIL